MTRFIDLNRFRVVQKSFLKWDEDTELKVEEEEEEESDITDEYETLSEARSQKPLQRGAADANKSPGSRARWCSFYTIKDGDFLLLTSQESFLGNIQGQHITRRTCQDENTRGLEILLA